MEISRQSKHYRFTSWVWGHFGKSPAKSLCGYFWQMVFAPFALIAFWGIIAFVVLLFVLFCLYLSGAMLSDVLHWIGILPDSFAANGSFNWRHMVISITLTTSVFGYLYRQEWKSTHEVKDNVVIAYVKAKKRKICPIIEYKD